MRFTGEVLRYFKDRGYGWIETPDNATLFYHIGEVPGRRILDAGTIISYELASDSQGRPRATKINIEVPVQSASNGQTGVSC